VRRVKMTITLDGNDYTHIVDTLFVEVKKVHLPEWINITGGSEVDTNVWTQGVFRVSYMIRVTDAEKWVLDQNLLAHTLIALVDAFYSIDKNVWFYSIEAEFDRKTNDAKPWLVTIELLVVL